MTSPHAPVPTIRNFSGLCHAIAGWLAANLPRAIRDALLGFAIGYLGNVFLMLFHYDGYQKTASGLATGTSTMLSGALTWGIGTAIVTSLLAYRRRVGKEQFWRDIRNLPALLGALLKEDGRLGRVHLLSGACIGLLTTCFVAPWASLALAAGLLAMVPSALRAVLSNLMLSIWSGVANRFAPARANPVGGAMAMTVGTLGAILALGVAFLVPSSLIKVAAAAVCGGLAWADSRRIPPSAALWMLLIAAAAVSGLSALLDPLTALAHDGGWSENHRSLVTWWNSAGSTPLLGYGLIGGVASGVGSAMGSAIGSVLSGVGVIPGTTAAGTASAPAGGGAEGYTPGVIYGTGSKEDPFRDYKDAAHPPWMAPYGDGTAANPYSDTPPPVIDTSPTPGDSGAGEASGPVVDKPASGTGAGEGGSGGKQGATTSSGAADTGGTAPATSTDGSSTAPNGPTGGQPPTSSTGATGTTAGEPTAPEPPGPVTPPPVPPGPVTPPPLPPPQPVIPQLPGPTGTEPPNSPQPKETKEGDDGDSLTKGIEGAGKIEDKLDDFSKRIKQAEDGLRLSPETKEKFKEWREKIDGLNEKVKAAKEKGESLKELQEKYNEVSKDIKDVVDNMTNVRNATKDINMDPRSAAGLQAISGGATAVGIALDKAVEKTLGKTAAKYLNAKELGPEVTKTVTKVTHDITRTQKEVYDDPDAAKDAMGADAYQQLQERRAAKQAAEDAKARQDAEAKTKQDQIESYR